MLKETWIISAVMMLLAALVIALPHVKRYYTKLLLTSTGALIGLCFFHLFPDLFMVGGYKGLSIVILVWGVYSVFHIFHSHQHIHDGEEVCRDSHANPYIFLTAISLHCFTSGLLMGISDQFSVQVSHTIFTTLLIHKALEAMIVVSVLLSYKMSRAWTFSRTSLYLASFPLGVYLADPFIKNFSQTALLVISGLAVGSLVGCLLFDFVIPSARHLKRRALHEILWLLAGFALTLLAV